MTAGREEKQTASPSEAGGWGGRTGWKQRPEEKEQPVEGEEGHKRLREEE